MKNALYFLAWVFMVVGAFHLEDRLVMLTALGISVFLVVSVIYRGDNMSDYSRNKCIRMKFPERLLEVLGVEDPEDCYDFLKKISEEVGGTSYFEVESTDNAVYLDWVYFHSYGEENGDFYKSDYIHPYEVTAIENIFNKLLIPYSVSDLRKVDYCYYNCCDANDCFDVTNTLLTSEELLGI